jgi:hypothetical protein
MSGIKLRPIVFKVVPPEPYTLLYEQAVQNYTGYPLTVMEGHTWETNKNFICYKMSVCVKSLEADGYESLYRGLQITNGNYTDSDTIRFGRSVDYQYSNEHTSTFFYTGIGTGSVGTDGQAFTGEIVQSSVTAYKANPDIKVSTDDGPITYRIIFDKTQNKAYCYITDKQVMVIDYGTTNVLGMPISNTIGHQMLSSRQSNVDFGIQVYGCETLEDALEC